MRKTVLTIAGVAAATLLAGGWALAQTAGYGQGGMRGMGPGMHGRMDGGMHGRMGGGMRDEMGPGMHGRMGLHGRMGGHMQGGMGMHGRMGPGMHGGPGQAQFDPAELDMLKSELGITAAQEAAWGKYAKAVQDAAAARTSARESIDPSEVGKLSPADRFAVRSKMREQAQAQFDAVKTAADELLATLDDAQKAMAEELLPGLAFGPGPMRGAMGGPRHRH